MTKLALRSEYVLNVQALLIREGDDFTYGGKSERGMFYDRPPKDFEHSRLVKGTHHCAHLSALGRPAPAGII